MMIHRALGDIVTFDNQSKITGESKSTPELYHVKLEPESNPEELSEIKQEIEESDPLEMDKVSQDSSP